MCEPLTIAGLALSAGSMVANQVASSKVEKARKGAMEAERIRQGGLQQESDALNLRSQERYEDFDGKQENRAAELADYFRSQNQSIPQAEGAPTETIPTSSSNIVTREREKQNTKAKDFSDQQSDALGNLRGFGDLLGDVSRQQGRDAAEIGTVGGFMRGSSSVLPMELEAANSKGNGMKMFGDLLSLGGSVAGGLGGMKAASGGSTIFSTPNVVGAAGPIKPNMFTPRTQTPLGKFFGVGENPFSIYG